MVVVSLFVLQRRDQGQEAMSLAKFMGGVGVTGIVISESLLLAALLGLHVWWKWCYHALSHCAEHDQWGAELKAPGPSTCEKGCSGVETGHCKGKVCRKHLQLILSFTAHGRDISFVCDRVYADFNPHLSKPPQQLPFACFILSRNLPWKGF